ncbi:MAG: hypothetical protein NTZ60_08175 [Campylobacterales bacterium]|nr:hypothetical protein [Campylobacterales bacterium]
MKIFDTINIFSLVVIITFLGGCAAANFGVGKQSKFIQYDNTNHIVGNKDIATKKLVYIEEINGAIYKQITFYIDKFPYKTDFNLCSDKKDFKTIKAVMIDKSAEQKAIYEDDPISCNGDIYVSLNNNSNNNFVGSYNMKFLDGFDVQDFHGYDLLLKHTASTSSSSFTVEDNSFEQDSIKQIVKKQYWYIKDLE